MEILVLILKKYWLPILLGIVVLIAFARYETVRVERDHYIKKVASLNLELKQIKDDEAVKKQEQEQLAADLTAKYKNTLATANTLVTENARLNSENIRNAKELRDVKLSLDTIRLFNASKQDTAQDVAPTIKGNDGNTSTTSKTSADVNLQDLLLVVNTNDSNHLKCIRQVEEWQHFWVDFVKKQEQVDANAN